MVPRINYLKNILSQNVHDKFLKKEIIYDTKSVFKSRLIFQIFKNSSSFIKKNDILHHRVHTQNASEFLITMKEQLGLKVFSCNTETTFINCKARYGKESFANIRGWRSLSIVHLAGNFRHISHFATNAPTF